MSTAAAAVPEFCPNPDCPYYRREASAAARWYCRFGSFPTAARGAIQRFRCKACRRTCSTQTFSLHYWTHSSEDYRGLLETLTSSGGLRQHARSINKSFRVVANRLRHLARNCLALLDAAGEAHPPLGEDLVIDGFESFTRSQYFPAHITTVVGSRSQFIYAAVHTLFRRKGRMSERQKQVRARIDRHWRPARGALIEDCAVLLADQAPAITSACALRQVRLCSDEHTAYPQALKRVAPLREALGSGRLVHHTVSSRRARTLSNPLFAVNYVDRQLRLCLGEYARETLKHGREVNAQMQRMAIFIAWHNFLAPHRVRDGVVAQGRRQATHASVAGLETARCQAVLDRLLSGRFLWGHCGQRQSWQQRIWLHQYRNPPAVDGHSGALRPAAVALPPGRLAKHFLA